MFTSKDSIQANIPRSTESYRWGDWPVVRSLIKSGIILDLGCGDGELTRPFNSVLVDLNSELLQKSAPPKPKIVGDIHNLPLRENLFSCVILNHVLEHSLNPSQVLSECRRVCTNNARLVINVPNRTSLIDIVLSHIGKNTALTAPEHHQHFSRASIFRLLNNNGFNQIRFHATFLYLTGKLGFNTKLPLLRELGKNIVVTTEVHKIGRKHIDPDVLLGSLAR